MGRAILSAAGLVFPAGKTAERYASDTVRGWHNAMHDGR